MQLSIGLNNCTQESTINPAKDSCFTEIGWDNFSDTDKQEWLDSQLREWAFEYIDMSVSLD